MIGYREERRKRPACPNCGKENSATMSSSRWGHNYPCCSDVCGQRLGKRLENGMIIHEQVREKMY